MNDAAERYRRKAIELLAIAAGNPILRFENRRLAHAYLRLAEVAKNNAQTDVVYETPNLWSFHSDDDSKP